MGFLHRVLGPRTQLADADEWVVVDLETTGLSPRLDRVVEIGLVRVTADGRELDAWTTILDPERDTGPVRIHGISARDVVGAPRFRDIAGELLGRLGGARLAAHNARFELGFIGAEFTRVGLDWGPPEMFCTMSVPSRLGVVHSRALVDCCSELGIPLENHHAALSDARAAASILLATLAASGPPRRFRPGHRTGPRPSRRLGCVREERLDLLRTVGCRISPPEWEFRPELMSPTRSLPRISACWIVSSKIAG